MKNIFGRECAIEKNKKAMGQYIKLFYLKNVWLKLSLKEKKLVLKNIYQTGTKTRRGKTLELTREKLHCCFNK